MDEDEHLGNLGLNKKSVKG